MEEHYRAEPVDEATLSDEERALRLRAGLDLEQIGFRRSLQANFHGLARQEYAEDSESCFLASGEAVFELVAIEKRLAELSEPIEKRYNDALSIWLPPVPDRQYLVAVDPAGGGQDGDYSAAQVLEIREGVQCAEYTAHVGGLSLARLVTELAAEYNHAWLVIERNNHGSGILALAEAVFAYPRIYYQNGQAGWLTSPVSKPAIIGDLGARLVNVPHCFRSRQLLAECRSYVYQPGGSTGARAGAHDDRIMAMAIGWAVRDELMTGRARALGDADRLDSRA